MSADPDPRNLAAAAPAAPSLTPEASSRRYEGAIVLVVGAGHGIGAACATRLAWEGACVIGADLDVDAVRSVVETLPTAGGGQHRALAMDVRDPDSVREGIAEAAAQGGRLDVLAHVAGGTIAHGDLEGAGEEVWQEIVDWNLMGAARTTRAAIGALRASRRGAIVTVTSVNALMPLRDAPYDAAKAGLISLTRDLAVHLAPEGIRVNAIAPGTVRTRVWEADGGESMRHYYPLGRVGEPADIAAALAFLASSEAAWITGQVLAVDGGLLLHGVGPGHRTA